VSRGVNAQVSFPVVTTLLAAALALSACGVGMKTASTSLAIKHLPKRVIVLWSYSVPGGSDAWSPNFNIPAWAAEWDESWSYLCGQGPQEVPLQTMVISANYPDPQVTPDAAVNTSSPARHPTPTNGGWQPHRIGHGIEHFHDTGMFGLDVFATGCSWRVSVFIPSIYHRLWNKDSGPATIHQWQ